MSGFTNKFSLSASKELFYSTFTLYGAIRCKEAGHGTFLSYRILCNDIIESANHFNDYWGTYTKSFKLF